MCISKTDADCPKHNYCVFLYTFKKTEVAATAVKSHVIPRVTASTSDGRIKFLNKRIKQMLHETMPSVRCGRSCSDIIEH